MWDEGYLELGEYPFPQMKEVHCLKIISKNSITYDNAFPLKKQTLLSKIRVNHVQDIIVAR